MRISDWSSDVCSSDLLFLGLVGVVFLVAIVSGVVVYAPFMRKLAFGTVRKDRSRRIKWLDTHNMVGIVTLGWVGVVGLTRSEEHTSELQSLMRISYAVFCLKKKINYLLCSLISFHHLCFTLIF